MLFSVSNHHVEGAGEPPFIDGDNPHLYVGYFANEYGEQAVFFFDRRTRKATLRMGDAGWGKKHKVIDGRVRGLVLTPSEAAWLVACWTSAVGSLP